MTKPKTVEEIKIYKELVEKYKDNKYAMDMIQGKYNNQTMKEDWQTTKEMLEWIVG